MKIKDLISELNKFDPEMEVVVKVNDHTDWMYKCSIVDIEENDPYDEEGISVIDGSDLDYDTMYKVDEENGGEVYVGPKCVILDIGSI